MQPKNTNHNLVYSACTSLKGVGPRLAIRLQEYGLITVQDLLFHLPLRYEDRTRITPIGSVREGDHVVIEATIELAELSQGRRPSLLCRVWDGTGYLTLRFFHFTEKQKFVFNRGKKLRCFGEIRGWSRELEMIHPEYEFVTPLTPALSQNCLTPVYPSTEGISQRLLRQLTEQALVMLTDEIVLPDYLPEVLLRHARFPSLATALRYIHRPPPDAAIDDLLLGIHPAQQRL